MPAPDKETAKYLQLVATIGLQIQQGVLKAGDALLSVRAARKAYQLSPSTIMQAYYLLESQGVIEARPRSGYYVCQTRPRKLAAPSVTTPVNTASELTVSDFIFQILDSVRDPSFVPLGSSFPDPASYPLSQLGRFLSKAAKQLTPSDTLQHLSPGYDALRRQIALRYLRLGATVSLDEIVVVSGAMEGISIALQAVTKPGDLVAIESPAFYGGLQAIERLGLKAIEVPTDPETGVSIEALANVLAEHPVKACLFMLNHQNPMGGVVPKPARHALLQLLAQYDLPLIEDDVYAELYHPNTTPICTKADNDAHRVIHVGSFAKSLAPGYRLGWVAAGRYAEAIRRIKLASSISTSLPIQMAIADYLETGNYDRHLRQLRATFFQNYLRLIEAIATHFPVGTKVSMPTGGYFLWVELPDDILALTLYERALAAGISIAPGPIFSVDGSYQHCIRLNFAYVDEAIEHHIAQLAALMSA